jgi:hypothetical protein
MPDDKKRRPLILLTTIALVATVDLSVRFLVDFRLDRVLWTEAVLFIAAGTLLLASGPRSAPVGWRRFVQVCLAVGFLLGGIRAGLWAAGVPVTAANATVLIIGLVAATIAWVRGRKVGQS